MVSAYVNGSRFVIYSGYGDNAEPACTLAYYMGAIGHHGDGHPWTPAAPPPAAFLQALQTVSSNCWNYHVTWTSNAFIVPYHLSYGSCKLSQ